MTSPQPPPDGAERDALHTLWCQAVDAVQSDDFRDHHGKLNEKAYLAYQRRAIAQCQAALARPRPAPPAAEQGEPPFAWLSATVAVGAQAAEQGEPTAAWPCPVWPDHGATCRCGESRPQPPPDGAGDELREAVRVLFDRHRGVSGGMLLNGGNLSRSQESAVKEFLARSRPASLAAEQDTQAERDALLRLFDEVVAEAGHQFGLSEQYQDRGDFDRLCQQFRAAMQQKERTDGR